MRRPRGRSRPEAGRASARRIADAPGSTRRRAAPRRSLVPRAPTPPLLFTPELDVMASIPVPSEDPGSIPARITKEGLGRMRLGGTNTYKGNTTVNGGTFFVTTDFVPTIAPSPIVTPGSTQASKPIQTFRPM